VKVPTVDEIVQKETEAGNIVKEEPKAVEKIAEVKKASIEVEKTVEVKETEPEIEEPKTESEETGFEIEETKTEVVSEQDVVEESEEESVDNLELNQQDTVVRRLDLELDEEVALLETVLFLESEPQTVENLVKITQFEEDVVRECLARLGEKYSNVDSGLELSRIIGGWMLTPKRECFEQVKERYGKRNEGRLSKAAIETLSIIAYSQPITRAEIESIRHVNADNMMRVLLERNFIEERGKKDVPGKPTLYGTTKEFLEFFHLQSINDLPKLDEKESERFELAR